MRPLKTARRITREDAYLATAARQVVGTPDGDVVTWQWGRVSDPLVGLVHGWEGRGSQMGAFAAPLVAAGFRVMTFDAPGYGESPGDVAHVPLVARVLVALERQLGPFAALVGHSMGAAAATAAATACRLRGLVMLAPPLSQLERVTRVAGRLGLSSEVRDAFVQASGPRRHPMRRRTAHSLGSSAALVEAELRFHLPPTASKVATSEQLKVRDEGGGWFAPKTYDIVAVGFLLTPIPRSLRVAV